MIGLYDYENNLIRAKNLETKNILMRLNSTTSVDTCKQLEYLPQLLGKQYIRPQHTKVFKTVQKLNGKIFSKEVVQ